VQKLIGKVVQDFEGAQIEKVVAKIRCSAESQDQAPNFAAHQIVDWGHPDSLRELLVAENEYLAVLLKWCKALGQQKGQEKATVIAKCKDMVKNMCCVAPGKGGVCAMELLARSALPALRAPPCVSEHPAVTIPDVKIEGGGSNGPPEAEFGGKLGLVVKAKAAKHASDPLIVANLDFVRKLMDILAKVLFPFANSHNVGFDQPEDITYDLGVLLKHLQRAEDAMGTGKYYQKVLWRHTDLFHGLNASEKHFRASSGRLAELLAMRNVVSHTMYLDGSESASESRGMRRSATIGKMFRHAQVLVEAISECIARSGGDQALLGVVQDADAAIGALQKQFGQSLHLRNRQDTLHKRVDVLIQTPGGEEDVVGAAWQLLSRLGDQLSGKHALDASTFILQALGARWVQPGEERSPTDNKPPSDRKAQCHADWVSSMVPSSSHIASPQADSSRATLYSARQDSPQQRALDENADTGRRGIEAGYKKSAQLRKTMSGGDNGGGGRS